MNAISNQYPELSAFFAPNKGEQGSLKRTQFANASFSENKSTDLTLFTAEGDKVTFSASSSRAASQSIYTNLGLLDGIATRTEVQSFSLSESFGFEMSVEGDLNAQELKDIQEAFKTIEKLSSDFFSGKTDTVMASAMKIAGLASISSFEAVIQYERSASLQQTTTSTSSVPTAKTTEQVVNQAPAAETSRAADKPSAEENLIDKMTEAILKTNVALEKAAKSSNKFFDRLYEQFEQNLDVAPSNLSSFRKIQSDVLDKLLGGNKAVEENPSGKTNHAKGAGDAPHVEDH